MNIYMSSRLICEDHQNQTLSNSGELNDPDTAINIIKSRDSSSSTKSNVVQCEDEINHEPEAGNPDPELLNYESIGENNRGTRHNSDVSCDEAAVVIQRCFRRRLSARQTIQLQGYEYIHKLQMIPPASDVDLDVMLLEKRLSILYASRADYIKAHQTSTDVPKDVLCASKLAATVEPEEAEQKTQEPMQQQLYKQEQEEKEKEDQLQLQEIEEREEQQEQIELENEMDTTDPVDQEFLCFLKRQIGFIRYNKNPSKGLQLLFECGALENTPGEVANFLFQNAANEKESNISKTMIGDYLSERDDFQAETLTAFLDLIDFKNISYYKAMIKCLSYFRLPGEAQKIDRMMEAFAIRYCNCNPGIFQSPDTAFILAFGIVILNTDLHNPKNVKKMTKDQFVANHRLSSKLNDISDTYLGEIYHEVSEMKVPICDEHMKKIEKLSQCFTGVPFKLPQPYRYLVENVGVVDAIAQKKRHMYLFNDLILITRRKSNNIKKYDVLAHCFLKYCVVEKLPIDDNKNVLIRITETSKDRDIQQLWLKIQIAEAKLFVQALVDCIAETRMVENDAYIPTQGDYGTIVIDRRTENQKFPIPRPLKPKSSKNKDFVSKGFSRSLTHSTKFKDQSKRYTKKIPENEPVNFALNSASSGDLGFKRKTIGVTSRSSSTTDLTAYTKSPSSLSSQSSSALRTLKPNSTGPSPRTSRAGASSGTSLRASSVPNESSNNELIHPVVDAREIQILRDGFDFDMSQGTVQLFADVLSHSSTQENEILTDLLDNVLSIECCLYQILLGTSVEEKYRALHNQCILELGKYKQLAKK